MNMTVRQVNITVRQWRIELNKAWFDAPKPWEANYHSLNYCTCEAWGNDR